MYSLWTNKLRSLLSLLGITVGILSIILVFTLTDSMEKNIKTSIESLGNDVIFIQKWPWEFGSDYPWWKYMNRPYPSWNEVKELEKRFSDKGMSAYFIHMNQGVMKFMSNSVSGVPVVGVSHKWGLMRSVTFEKGRYFSADESDAGRPLIILGAALANGLFGSLDPMGRKVRYMGRDLRVIGIFKREGESPFNPSSLDNQAVIPVNFARNVTDIDGDQMNPTIMVKSLPQNSMSYTESELKIMMRSIRRIAPTEEDDFALNKITMISKGLDQFFTILGLAGWIIGGLSILVGGFGIANIMFVSVKERTPQIGIQKSLGARRSFILIQFLAESVTLCTMGGVLGLFFVFNLTYILSNIFNFNVSLAGSNIVLGLLISVITGVVFGILPALKASAMDPVEAIRKGI